jgi:octaprenyl-diphosphate synthase
MTPALQDHDGIPQASAKERFAHALTLVPEITTVEARIRSTFKSDVAIMREIPEYLLSLGGKRIRPILALLCSKALGAQEITDDIVDIAAGIELIHMATLMHDDIIDQSPIRRHKPSAYAKYGTPGTLLSGDFLLTRAFGLCSRLDREIIEATEQACIELVEGETLEIAVPLGEHTTESSLTIATRKTASLFRLAAFCGASLTDSPDDMKEKMAGVDFAGLSEHSSSSRMETTPFFRTVRPLDLTFLSSDGGVFLSPLSSRGPFSSSSSVSTG